MKLAEQGVASDQDRVRAEEQLKAQQAAVNSAQKNVDAAQASLNMAKARIHQQRAAASNVATNEAQVANARAQLAEAETRLGYTKIYAPVSGTVSVRATRQGEVVNPGTPIVTIVDFGDTWVRADSAGDGEPLHRRGRQVPGALAAGQADRGHVIFKAVESDYATQRDVSRRKRDIKTIGLKLKVDNPEGRTGSRHDRRSAAAERSRRGVRDELDASQTLKLSAEGCRSPATPSWSITSARSTATSPPSTTFRLP